MNDLTVAVTAARAAAEVVAAGFGKEVDVALKGRSNPVTEVDRAAEAAIVAVLTEHRPGDGIVGEEGTDVSGEAARRWLVDPLDGTVNFVHGLPIVSVSVALYDGDAGCAAAVIDVTRREEYTAARGEGARCNGTPIAVSATADFADAVVGTGFAYDRNTYPEEYLRAVARVLRGANDVRRLGSAALDLCWVAAGRYDGYWEYGLMPWDLAAGALIAAEAGATVTTLAGEALTPFHRHVVATNGRIHDELRRIAHEEKPAHLEMVTGR